ncbi:50S ribosomal protein L11 methyltransferase [Leuconostocaceae bacterium ESL0723]|nr:50S ribosomal protein L11 methyltransferase [Leuconostocaceae bacterium ESL0723]
MTWLALTYTVPSAQIDLVNAELTDLGLTGAWIQDAGNQLSKITVYLDRDAQTNVTPEQIQDRLDQLQANGVDLSPLKLDEQEVDDSAWADSWKPYYHAQRITQQLTVVPQWEDYQREQAGEKLIVLDPQLSFGTGTHETTRLSMQALEAVVRGGESMIDVGTGSGVLAVAAKLLGVGKVIATDLDEEAVAVAKQNLALNPVAKDVEVLVSDRLNQVQTDPVDLIVANILADVIEPLVPQAEQNLKPGGYFLVSGIYTDQAAKIERALRAHDFDLEQVSQRGPWYGYIARKKG